MSERDGYPHGVPHWTTCLVRDLDRATDFYGRIFGWDFDMSPDHGYAVATLRGREVAGIGTVAAAGADARPGWITEVRVDDAPAAADAVSRAGGSVLAGPMDMSPASVLTVVADPAGALLCATQPLGRAGAQLVNEPGTWTMSALSTPDPSAVAEFYRDVFGWEREQFGAMTLWRLPGYVGGEPSQPVARDVIAAARPSDGPPRWDVDFRIADADAAARAAYDAGGTVVAEPADEDSVPFRQAVLADPDGAVFSVSQLRL
jgi:predicted enzyme related to lactoylglutathione lyase